MGQNSSKDKKLKAIEDQLTHVATIQQKFLEIQEKSVHHESDDLKEKLEIQKAKNELDHVNARQQINEYEYRLEAENLTISEKTDEFEKKFTNNSNKRIHDIWKQRAAELHKNKEKIHGLIKIWNGYNAEKQRDMGAICLSNLKNAFNEYHSAYIKFVRTNEYSYN